MPIHTKVENNIAEVVFDFPPVNAFNGETWNEIPKVITELGKRQDVKVILIRSEGKGFCAGVDIKELAHDGSAIVGLNKGNFETGKAIHHCEVPVIVAAHKFIIGGGVIMCGAADIVIASDDAYFSLPEIDRGAMGGAAHLQRMLPIAKVRAAFLTGGKIPAQEAYRLGGIEKVVPMADLVDTAMDYAKTLAEKSREALRIAKQALNGIEPLDIEEAYRWEQGFTFEMYMHEDSQKSRDAFVETGKAADFKKELMDIEYTSTQKQFRAEVREWLSTHVPKQRLPSFDTEEGFELHREWERTLAKDKWGNVNWPEEYGGRGLDLVSWLIFEEEYYRADAPLRVSQNGIFLLAPTIMEYGTDEQKARFLPPMASGDEVWAQAWSEPGAGSDMAAIRTKAVRDGDCYVISGQKTWSSRAVFADWCFALVRTEEGSERHKGLSKILIPLDSEGLTRRPIAQLDGDPGFAELFFDEVRVPAENLLGPEHGGWGVAMATAGFERGLLLRSPARFQAAAARLVKLYKEHKDRLSSGVGEQVIQAWMNTERFCAATYQLVSRVQAGASISSESSANKLFWSEMDKHLHRTAMTIMGAQAELEDGLDAIDNGRWLDGYMFSLAGPIYAGTNEIQRNILAERVLGFAEALMDFRFTEDQQDLIDAAKAFFDGENTPERIRKMVAGEEVENLWPQFARLGLLGIMVSESAGGLEQPLVVMAGVAEAAGYAGLPEPYVELAGITVPHAKEDELSGQIRRAVRSDLRPYEDVSLTDTGEAVSSIDPLRRLVKAEGGNDETIESVNFHGAVLTAAQLIGLSQRMVDMSVDYAKDRHQFGKAIGSFQAVKHQLANVYTQIEFTRPIIHLAAIKGGAAVHNAKVAAIDTAMLAAETAIQIHGGMGYTYEVDLHLFMKRAWALCGEWGDRNYHMKKLEDYIFTGDAELGPGQTFN